MRRYLTQKIQELQRKPTHVRMRIATGVTVTAGAVVILLWGTLFLPFQYRLRRDTTGKIYEDPLVSTIQERYKEVTEGLQEQQVTASPQVGGAERRVDIPQQYLRQQGELPLLPSEDTIEESTSPSPTPSGEGGQQGEEKGSAARESVEPIESGSADAGG